MNKIACAVFALLPSLAFAYPTEVEKHLNATEVDYQVQDIGDSMGALLLQNYGKQDVNCSVLFVNGPEAPKLRKIALPAGKNGNVTATFSRAIIKLRVTLTCHPA